MFRIISFTQNVFVLYLIISVSIIECKNDKTEVQENKRSTADNFIVSIINGIIKFKDSNPLTSGIEASVRSVFSKPLTSAVYAVSMLIGVVAMLAFYESPVSPLPVPPLPDPPVGRFPPEHPIWPPPPKDAVKFSDKKRVGVGNGFAVTNSHTLYQNPQHFMPHANQQLSHKFSGADPTRNMAAYQQLINLLEKRNSKVHSKPNRVSTDSVGTHFSDMLNFPMVSAESNQKLINESSIQSLYTTKHEFKQNENPDSLNKFHHKSSLGDAFDKLMDLNRINELQKLDVNKDTADKFNHTTSLTNELNSIRRLKVKNET